MIENIKICNSSSPDRGFLAVVCFGRRKSGTKIFCS